MGVADPYERITWRGVTLNRRTAAMMEKAQKRFGRPFDSIPQGSYHAGTPASAGTHDGGGAVDIFDAGDLDRVQHVMRAVGFAAWHRTFVPGPNGWHRHVHAIALGDKEMSDGARAQIPDYRNYRDGLASHAADNSWHPFPKGADPKPIFDYHQWLENQHMDINLGQDAYPASHKNKTTVGDLLHVLNHFDEFRAGVGHRFDVVGNRFDAVGNRFDAVGNRFNKVEAAVADNAADLDKALNKLDKVLELLRNP
jgi:hypothetical protein